MLTALQYLEKYINIDGSCFTIGRHQHDTEEFRFEGQAIF